MFIGLLMFSQSQASLKCRFHLTHLVSNFLRSVARILLHSPRKFNYVLDIHAGFPPIREFRENFEDFFQSGKSGKNGFFSQNQGKKFQIRELFPQTIFKPFKPINLRKMFFKNVKPQELLGNCNICTD